MPVEMRRIYTTEDRVTRRIMGGEFSSNDISSHFSHHIHVVLPTAV